MAGKRTDNKGRVLKEGESQRANLTYMYRYTDACGKRQAVYAPTLQSLREKEDKLAHTAALIGANQRRRARLEIWCNSIFISEPARGKPKSNSGYRTIPMSVDVYEAMLRIADRASQVKVVHVVDGYSDFLVLDTRGNLNTVNKFDGTLRRIRASHNKNSALQIEALSPHILRHTFCTNMALLGILPVHLNT